MRSYTSTHDKTGALLRDLSCIKSLCLNFPVSFFLLPKKTDQPILPFAPLRSHGRFDYSPIHQRPNYRWPNGALAAPRFLLGKTFSDSTDNLKIESDVPVDVLNELKRGCHALSLFEAQSLLMGNPGAIAIYKQTGVMTAAHDPRSDGMAIGV